MRGGRGCGDRERLDRINFNRNDVVLMLQPALDEKKRMAHDRDAIFRKHIRRNDGVRKPRVVLESKNRRLTPRDDMRNRHRAIRTARKF